MGRTVGKLAPFLREALESAKYPNLQWDASYGFEVAFSIDIPRFDQKKVLDSQEKFLKGWYSVNDKLNKYPGYSTAKAVVQAALKKSVYLINIPCDGKRLLFRFATDEEKKEKQRLLKLKSNTGNEEFQPSSPKLAPSSPGASSVASDISFTSPLHSPLSATSSGYHSDGSYPEEKMQLSDEFEPVARDELWSGDHLYSSLPEVKSPPPVEDEQISDRNMLSFDDQDISESLWNEIEKILNNNHLSKNFKLLDFKQDDLELFESLKETQEKPVVEELTPVIIDTPMTVKRTYWHCTQKFETGSTLILICEKMVTENENIQEGHICIPDSALKPGVEYYEGKHYEYGGKLFYFLSSATV